MPRSRFSRRPCVLRALALFWDAALLMDSVLLRPLGFLLFPLGLLGLALTLVHSSAGYYIATTTGIVPGATVVTGVQYIYLWTLDAVVWSIAYGSLGWLIDAMMSRLRIATAERSS